MIDFQSILVYVGILIISFVLASYAEKKNSKKSVWTIIFIFSIIAGLRATTVGIDTKTYSIVFSLVSDGHVKAMYGIEKSFIQISSLLLKIWDNQQFLFFIFAFITHSLIILKLWNERQFISFKWAVLSYFVLLYSFSLNGMRQLIAVAIVFYSTGLVRNGKYLHFIFLILVATLFHTSALIGISYLFFEILFTKYFNEKRKLYAWLLIILSLIIGLTIVSDILSMYSKYFQVRNSSLGLMIIVKILLLLFSFVIIKLPKDVKSRYLSYSYRWNYFVGLILNSLNYFFFYLGRIGIYFYVFEALYVGSIFKLKNRNYYILFFKIIYALLLLYYFYEMITKGSQGELPYRFFWQR